MSEQRGRHCKVHTGILNEYINTLISGTTTFYPAKSTMHIDDFSCTIHLLSLLA